jgi:hypothetical protein
MSDGGVVPVGLKVGAIGGVVAGAIALLNMLPGLQLCLACIILILYFLTFLGSGVLAAYWLPPSKNAAMGARAGAIAGTIAGVSGGVVNTIITVARSALGEKLLTEAQVSQLVDIGFGAELLDFLVSPVGSGAAGTACCTGSLVIAAALGALGGFIMAAVERG